MIKPPRPLRADETLAPRFTPVPRSRTRHDGWTDDRQRQFIMALAVTGSVGAATKMVQMSRKSAYGLRNRPGARSFAWAWDIAISSGRARVFDYMLDRALNGVTTITVKLGGAVEIGHGADRRLISAALQAPLPGHEHWPRKGDIG